MPDDAGHRGAEARRPGLQQIGPMAACAISLLLLTLAGPRLDAAPLPLTLLILAALFGVILWGAVGVMRHAEAVAHVLGEPLGTLVLTMSAITVEIALIVSVMLVGESEPTLARDTMFAVLMIILNGLVGTALLLGGLRHRQQSYNLEGARAFLVVLIPLAVCALVLPNSRLITTGHTFSADQGIILAAVTLLLYAVFLALQTSRHRGFFTEAAPAAHAAAEPAGPMPGSGHGPSLPFHAALLLLTLVPVALLADHLAQVLDTVDKAVGLPPELVGVIIATLILAPEGLSALRAAWANHLQRSVNILLGSALSTIGMTVPAVLLTAYVIGHEIALGLQQEYVTLLAVTMLVSTLTFGGSRTDMLKGAVHLVIFAIYLMLVMLP